VRGKRQREGRPLDSYIVAYDIADPKRLRKVATACEDFGYRKQFSVFLCRLSATDFVRLRSRLYDLVNLEQDQVLFIPLCAKCVNQIEAIGRPTEAADGKDVVLVV
jgi:CRISPR-associated protein Cas2